MAKMTILKPGQKSLKGETIDLLKKVQKEKDDLVKEYQDIILRDSKKFETLFKNHSLSRSLNVILFISLVGSLLFNFFHK
jgi:hypothetical protein